VKENAMVNNSNSNQNHQEKIIIVDNIYLLDEVAKEFQNSGEQREDLIQAGYIGLLSAINLYYNRGEEIFRKKAKVLIAGEMRNYIRQKHKK